VKAPAGRGAFVKAVPYLAVAFEQPGRSHVVVEPDRKFKPVKLDPSRFGTPPTGCAASQLTFAAWRAYWTPPAAG
jgi:hypothetical protein